MAEYEIAKELELTGTDQDIASLKDFDAQAKLLHNLKVLKHGLKDRRNGSIVTLWNFIYGNVPRLQEQWRFWYEDLLAQKPNLPHEPLFLFWLTRALSEHLVHHHLCVILTPEMISTWYEDWALLQTEENTIIFMTLMNTLESISFDISAAEEAPSSDANDELQVVRRVKSRKIVKRKTIKIADSSEPSFVPSDTIAIPVEEAPTDNDGGVAMRKLDEERKRLQQESKIAAEEVAAAMAIAERLRKEALDREEALAQQRAELDAEQERKEQDLREQQERLDAQALELTLEKRRMEEEVEANRLAALQRAQAEEAEENDRRYAAQLAAERERMAAKAAEKAREAERERVAQIAAAEERERQLEADAQRAEEAKRALEISHRQAEEEAARLAEKEVALASERQRLAASQQEEETARADAEKERLVAIQRAEDETIKAALEMDVLSALQKAEGDSAVAASFAAINNAQTGPEHESASETHDLDNSATEVVEIVESPSSPEVRPSDQPFPAPDDSQAGLTGPLIDETNIPRSTPTEIDDASPLDEDFRAVSELASLVAESVRASESDLKGDSTPDTVHHEPISAMDMLAEVRKAADEAAAAAAEFERKFSELSTGSAISKAEAPHESIGTLEEPDSAVEQPSSRELEASTSKPIVSLKDLDPEARRRAISEKLRLLRALDGSGQAGEEDPEKPDKESENPAPVAPSAGLSAVTPASISHPQSAADAQILTQNEEQPERWRQLEQDLKRMRAEQESLQQEAFEAERQRRTLQAEAEAMRLLEEARKKRIEQEEEELARQAAEEEANRERERLALVAELSAARGSPAPQLFNDREKEERLREDLEAEKTRLRLQKELGLNLDSLSYSDSPKRTHSASSSNSPSPTSSAVSSRRSSSILAASPSMSTRLKDPPGRSRAMTDFDAQVGVLLDSHDDYDMSPEDSDDFQPKNPNRKALSFRKPYSYEKTVLSPNGAQERPSGGRSEVASAIPALSNDAPSFSQYANPDGLSHSYMQSGRTPRETDEIFGSLVDPTLRETASSSDRTNPSDGISNIQPQLQKRLEAAKRTEIQQMRAQAAALESEQEDDLAKSKQNFTLEDFLSGELDGLEEDTSTSPFQLPSQSQVPAPLQESEDPVGAWAPPKKRVYFNIQVKSTPEAQGNLCTGCGKQFQSGLFGKNARYCDYSGKYFCPDCHSKQVSMIPARVIRAWDFKPYQVSNFYRAFLVQMFKEPLYDVDAICPGSYQLVPLLKQIKVVRIMLSYMRDYTASCRKREQLIAVAEKLTLGRTHLYEGTSYSLNDFIEIQKGKLLDPLIQLCKIWMHHILYCEICRAKGSYCEFCRSNEIIYPFHLRYTVVCKECRAVSHRKCFKKGECPRCKRLQQRKAESSVPQ